MVQSLNTKAIYTFATMVLRRPNLMVPHISVDTISDIDFVALKECNQGTNNNIRAIVFDKDHTLTWPYDNHQIHPLAQLGLQQCLSVFGKHNVAILSNSVGTNDDVYSSDADADTHDGTNNTVSCPGAIQIERSLGISVIRHTIKKPGGIQEVMDHFKNSDSIVTHPSQICMIGDRILTDVVFGNLYNMLTIHTAPFPVIVDETTTNSTSSNNVINDNDHWTAKVIRSIENKLLYRSNNDHHSSTTGWSKRHRRRRFVPKPIPHPVYEPYMMFTQQQQQQPTK